VRAYQGGHTARGAVSLERLAQDANGDLIYTFTHPWSDGTTGIRLSSVELLEKLAAGEQPTLSGARCASVHGFSLHTRLAPWAACAFAALRGARRVAGGLSGGLAGAGATGGWHPVVQGGRQGERAPSVEKAV
jgi:hypothetical protein